MINTHIPDRLHIRTSQSETIRLRNILLFHEFTVGANSYAFTLLELLIAICMICILLACLIPCLYSAREGARKATCQSNEHQIAQALQIYAQDFDEKFPAWDTSYLTSPKAPESADRHWKYAVNAYVQKVVVASSSDGRKHMHEVGVWQCPSSGAWLDGLDWKLSSNNAATPATQPSTASYGLNMFLAYDFYGPKPVRPATRYRPGILIATLRSPADTVLVGEAGLWGRVGNPVKKNWLEDLTKYGNNHVQNWERRDMHNGGSNYVFCDGHVRWLSAEDAYPADQIKAILSARHYFAATVEDYDGLAKL